MVPRERLSRDRIAVAALDFVDCHGQEALSMRKLGAALGVEAMSLYNHVANKDEILDAVGNLLYQEVLDGLGADVDQWQDDVRNMVNAVRSVAHRHPNALDLLTDRVIPSSIKYSFLDTCYRMFTKSGFSLKDAALAFDTTSSWVVGALHQELGLMAALADTDTIAGNAAPSVALEGVVDFAEACLAWTPDQRFEFGLQTLVAGLEFQLSQRAR